MKINEKSIQHLLDSIYDNALSGLPGSETVQELAEHYLQHNHNDPVKAAESLIRWQIAKCGVSGFISGLGGLLTLPVAIPADLAATWYVQMRMSAAIAYMFEYDLSCDQVKTFIYACLVGDGLKDLLKGTGVQIGKKLTNEAIKGISRELIVKINQKVGFKLVTKFGEKGVINLVKVIPVAGGFVGASFNSYYCLKVGDTAISLFRNEGKAA